MQRSRTWLAGEARARVRLGQGLVLTAIFPTVVTAAMKCSAVEHAYICLQLMVRGIPWALAFSMHPCLLPSPRYALPRSLMHDLCHAHVPDTMACSWRDPWMDRPRRAGGHFLRESQVFGPQPQRWRAVSAVCGRLCLRLPVCGLHGGDGVRGESAKALVAVELSDVHSSRATPSLRTSPLLALPSPRC